MLRLALPQADGSAEPLAQSSLGTRHATLGKVRYFGDYELLEEIARGGMGIVFKARQVGLNRLVAVKMLPFGEFASDEFVKRFRVEAQAVASLQHPHIVAIHEIGVHEGQHYFSMDYVEGQTLAERAQNNPLPPEMAADYVKTIAEAIHCAHQHGVLHRDLKPSNVLIDSLDQPRITDFGLAKRLQGDANLTLAGQVFGTPNFMPPEQAGAQRGALSTASDVYSLGAILFFLLTGRPPFQAQTLEDTLRQVLEAAPPGPRSLNPAVPRDLEVICLKCLSKEPGARYGSAAALAEDLERWLAGEPILARPAGFPERVWRWCRRKPALAGAGAAVGLLLLAVAIGSPIALVRINRERRHAEAARKQAEANERKAQTEAGKSQQVAQFLKDMLKGVGPSVALGRDTKLLREILDKTAERVGRELQDQPEVQGDIWLTLGNTHRDIGDYPRAISTFSNAVRSYRTVAACDDAKLALALGLLGRCQSFTGQVFVGNTNALLGLAMARKCADQETLISCLIAAAYSFQSWGQGSTSSVPYLREALVLRQQQGTNPVAVADCLRGLAAHLSDDKEAESLNRQALVLHRQHLEPDHPAIASDLFGLGQNLLSSGQLEEAESTLRETYARYQKIHDPNHPLQAVVLRHLVEALLLRRKGDEAESLVREQLAATPTHPGHADVLRRLLAFRSEWALDEELLKHLKGEFLMWDLADVFAKAGKLEEVEQLYREGLRKLRERSGSDDLKLAGPIHHLADLCVRQGKLAEAEGLGRELVALRRKVSGNNHRETIDARFYLATLLIRQGKLAEAETLHHAIAEDLPGVRGHIYGRAGRWKEAAAAFARNIELGSDNPEHYRLLAPCLLISGDVEGYRKICQQIVTRFAGTVDAVVADGVVRFCLLSPDAGVDVNVVAGLADTAVHLGKQHKYLPWFELGKALAEYRQSHFASAADWAQQTLGSAGLLERNATAYSVLAMAQWQLKQDRAARVALGKAVEHVEERLPRLDGGDVGNWADIIAAHILLREARALIEGGSPSTAGRISARQ